MATNLELLAKAGIIDANNLPNAGDVTTINNLSQGDVQGLINVYTAVGSPFLARNCGPAGNSTGPQQGVRTIGIVF